MTWLLFILLAFLAGSIPFGLLIGRIKGIDIREHGSKNIGATNVGRVLGKPFGALCFALDAAKGAGPLLCTPFPQRIQFSPLLLGQISGPARKTARMPIQQPSSIPQILLQIEPPPALPIAYADASRDAPLGFKPVHSAASYPQNGGYLIHCQ